MLTYLAFRQKMNNQTTDNYIHAESDVNKLPMLVSTPSTSITEGFSRSLSSTVMRKIVHGQSSQRFDHSPSSISPRRIGSDLFLPLHSFEISFLPVALSEQWITTNDDNEVS